MGTVTKFVYIILAALLILEPQIVTDDILSVSRRHVMTTANLGILLVAYILFLVTKRDLAKKEREKRVVEMKLTQSRGTLSDAFAYIGMLNRRLPLLKHLTTDVVKRDATTKKDRKRIFEELLTTAVASVARAEWGTFRFVQVDRQQTVQEYFFGERPALKISNRALLDIPDSETLVSYIDSVCCLATADRTSSTRCFFLLPAFQRADEKDDMVLQSIVDQAQMLYIHFMNSTHESQKNGTVEKSTESLDVKKIQP